MGEKVNLNVHTQRRAYIKGLHDGLDGAVQALIEGGDINYLLEYIENNATPETVAKMDAFYAARNAR